MGKPIFPVLGKIKGASSLIISRFNINKKIKPKIANPPIIINA